MGSFPISLDRQMSTKLWRNTYSFCWPGRQLLHKWLQKTSQEREKSIQPGHVGAGPDPNCPECKSNRMCLASTFWQPCLWNAILNQRWGDSLFLHGEIPKWQIHLFRPDGRTSPWEQSPSSSYPANKVHLAYFSSLPARWPVPSMKGLKLPLLHIRIKFISICLLWHLQKLLLRCKTYSV